MTERKPTTEALPNLLKTATDLTQTATETLPDPALPALPDPATFGLTKAAYSVNECLKLLNISRASFYRMVNTGKLRICRFGTRTLALTPDLLRFLVHLREHGVEPRPPRPGGITSYIALCRARQLAPGKEATPAKSGKPPMLPPARSTRRKIREEKQERV
jgi:hypothetical protein